MAKKLKPSFSAYAQQSVKEGVAVDDHGLMLIAAAAVVTLAFMYLEFHLDHAQP